MTKEQLFEKLKHYNIELSEACDLIFNKTQAVISSRKVLLHLKRYGKLSAALRASFSFLFRELDNDRQTHKN